MTDGSGREQDKCWGAAGIVAIPSAHFVQTVQVGGSGTSDTVERAEFQALLFSLEVAHKWTKDLQKRKKVFTYWVTDRESLALAVGRDRNKTGSPPFYRRDSTPDLWASFEYYERIFNINPVFVPRLKSVWHDQVDIRSSEAREMFKTTREEWTLQDQDLYVPLIRAWNNPAWFEKCVQEVAAAFAEVTANGTGAKILQGIYGRPTIELARSLLCARGDCEGPVGPGLGSLLP